MNDPNRRWNEIDQVFGEALDLEPEERDPFLASRCAGDPELKAEALRLLEATESFGPPKPPFQVWITENSDDLVAGRAEGIARQFDHSTSPPRETRVQFSATFTVEDQKGVRSETHQRILSGDFTGAIQGLSVPGLSGQALGAQMQQIKALEGLGAPALAELGFTTMMCEVR